MQKKKQKRRKTCHLQRHVDRHPVDHLEQHLDHVLPLVRVVVVEQDAVRSRALRGFRGSVREAREQGRALGDAAARGGGRRGGGGGDDEREGGARRSRGFFGGGSTCGFACSFCSEFWRGRRGRASVRGAGVEGGFRGLEKRGRGLFFFFFFFRPSFCLFLKARSLPPKRAHLPSADPREERLDTLQPDVDVRRSEVIPARRCLKERLIV